MHVTKTYLKYANITPYSVRVVFPRLIRLCSDQKA